MTVQLVILWIIRVWRHLCKAYDLIYYEGFVKFYKKKIEFYFNNA